MGRSSPGGDGMTRPIPQTDSGAAVDTSYLVPTFEPGDSPTNVDPVSQTVLDLVRSVDPEDNSLTAAQARATSAAHRREWQTRLGIPDDWSEIPAGTPIAIGKVVEHGGLYFAARVAHNRGGSGPDGDDTNWILLSNWGGTWTDKWWPRGTIVSRGGYPYVATAVVRAGSPAPNATTNVLWLLLGAIPPQVRSYSANFIVTAVMRGWTFRATGSTTRLLSLPNASGAGEVPDGWEAVVANGSSADQTVSPNGTDQIGGSGALTLASGRAVRLQKVASGVWIVIADTKDEVGSGGSAFVPSKANLYEAVKAIFVHNTAISADDANNELDFASGMAGAIADNSIAPIKAMAALATEKKAWRERLGSSSIGLVANALPAVANHNVGDTLIIGRGGTTVVPFREIDEPAAELTDTVAGDVMMLLAAGWSRVGNLFSGGIAAAAARVIANNAASAAAAAQLDADTVIQIGPPFAVVPRSATSTPQRNLYVSIRRPIGAYSDANLLSVSVEGTTPNLQTYAANELITIYTVGIDANAMNNLASQGHFAEGNYVEVDVRLIDGRNGPVIFQRWVDVPVETTPGSFDLRAAAAASATPAPADRFFFSDENQPGDPLRFVQMTGLAQAMAPEVVQVLTPAAVTINSNAEFTLATARITPRSATTRVRVEGAFEAQSPVGNGNGDLIMRLRLYRGNTMIREISFADNHIPQNDNFLAPMFAAVIDSPAAAAEQTYTLRAIRAGRGQNWSITDRQLILTEVL